MCVIKYIFPLFFPYGVQILYAMPFVPCYMLAFLKLLFLIPQVGSRQSIDICSVFLAHRNSGPGLGMVRCVQQQKQKMKFRVHPDTSLWLKSHRALFAVLVQVSTIIVLLRLYLGFIQLSSLGEVMGDSERGGQGPPWSLHRHKLLLLPSCREAELALKHLGIMHRGRRQNGFSLKSFYCFQFACSKCWREGRPVVVTSRGLA